MSKRGAWLAIAAAATIAGCDGPLASDRPTEVRVQRIITRAGERIISYTAMYHDGVETYIDRAPAGSVDMITVERESTNEGAPLRLVRDESRTVLPADGPEAGGITDAWDRRFEAIDELVDADSVPWSDAHGVLTPAEIDAAAPASPSPAAAPNSGR